jgi:septation ring formation regulator EzrA
MSRRRKQKSYKVQVPGASEPTSASTEVDDLRNQYNTQYSQLQQQSLAAEQAYQSQLKSLQSQYDQQISLLGGQLGSQQQQYSLLQQQFAQQQERARQEYEKQKKYYDELLQKQKEQATREQEASRRALAEAEQAQGLLQTDALQALGRSQGLSKSKSQPLVSKTSSSVTRGSQGYSLLRR